MNGRRNGNGKAAPAIRQCAVYTRKSTAVEAGQEFSSLDAQRASCEAYIRSQPGWEVMPERYDDENRTGGNLDRPAFQRLMGDLEAGKLDTVVVYKVDRLSRSLADFVRVMEHLDRLGASFVSVTQHFTTTDSMGRLTMNLLASFSEFERAMISERTRDKIIATRKKGRWTGGFGPLGYDLAEKKLVPNEVERALVRDVFDLYLEHRSAGAVARHLNRAGRFTKHVALRSGRIRQGHPWSRPDVLRTLRNVIYVGLMPCGDEVYPAEHEPIVDRAVFDRAQALLDEAGGDRPSHGTNPAYLLRGLLRCGCGAAMTPASTKKKTGHVYRYYRCSGRAKRGSNACAAREMPAGAIEDFVVEQIRGLATDANIAADVADRVRERLTGRREALALERKRLPASIAGLSADARKLIDTLADLEPASRRLVDARLADISGQIAAQETRLAEVERQVAALDNIQVEAEMVARLLQDFDVVWGALTVENRGRLVRALVKEVVVNEAAGQVTVTLADLTGEPTAPEEVQA